MTKARSGQVAIGRSMVPVLRGNEWSHVSKGTVSRKVHHGNAASSHLPPAAL